MAAASSTTEPSFSNTALELRASCVVFWGGIAKHVGG